MMNCPQEDRLLSHARREALVVACVWLAAMLYTVGYCTAFGYRPPDTHELKLVFGFPDWVFWGIVTPWVACVAFGFWFSYAFMRDDDVNEGAPPESDTTGHQSQEIAGG